MVPFPERAREDFGGGALALFGVCAVALGWSPGRFWGATPAEVAAVVAALVPRGERPVDGDTLTRLREAFPDG